MDELINEYHLMKEEEAQDKYIKVPELREDLLCPACENMYCEARMEGCDQTCPLFGPDVELPY